MIQIVEDAAMIAQHIAEMCEAKGLAVQVVSLGRKALANAATTYYRLMVVDLRLPDIHGVDLIKSIRALPAPYGTVPILAATGESRRALVDALRAGADGVLEKPYRLEVLHARIMELIRD